MVQRRGQVLREPCGKSIPFSAHSHDHRQWQHPTLTCTHLPSRGTSALQVNHLHLIKSETYGYEPAAQAYSAPRALMFWAAIFLALHMLTAVADLVGLIFHAPALLLAMIILVSFWQMHTTLRHTFTLPPREQDLQW